MSPVCIFFSVFQTCTVRWTNCIQMQDFLCFNWLVCNMFIWKKKKRKYSEHLFFFWGVELELVHFEIDVNAERVISSDRMEMKQMEKVHKLSEKKRSSYVSMYRIKVNLQLIRLTKQIRNGTSEIECNSLEHCTQFSIFMQSHRCAFNELKKYSALKLR